MLPLILLIAPVNVQEPLLRQIRKYQVEVVASETIPEDLVNGSRYDLVIIDDEIGIDQSNTFLKQVSKSSEWNIPIVLLYNLEDNWQKIVHLDFVKGSKKPCGNDILGSILGEYIKDVKRRENKMLVVIPASFNTSLGNFIIGIPDVHYDVTSKLKTAADLIENGSYKVILIQSKVLEESAFNFFEYLKQLTLIHEPSFILLGGNNLHKQLGDIEFDIYKVDPPFDQDGLRTLIQEQLSTLELK